MDEYFKNKMIELSKKININLNDNQIQKYFEYMNLLIEWNEKINITAITETNDIILKHFIDSLTALKFIDGNVIDVGTGAGFPGIPLAVANENMSITLLDSLNKRVMFLEEVKERLSLKNVTCIHSRAEEFAQKNREIFDTAISRAVANLSTLSEYLLPFVKVGGYAICMKGPEIEQEIKDAEYAIKELGGKIEKIENFLLPESDITRNIIIIKKVKEAPKKYPRKAGTPSKEPLHS